MNERESVMNKVGNSLAVLLVAAGMLALGASRVLAQDPPIQRVRGQVPVLFTGAEGEDGTVPTFLADGVTEIRGDDIFLWVPAVVAGNVDLGTTGSFFKIWDSGPEAGPNGNDDDRNGMRGMDFDQTTGSFLISYEDTTTTGFAIGGVKDGALLRMTPTAVTGGSVSAFALSLLLDEGTNGTAGNLALGDPNAISLAKDGTLYIGSGKTDTWQTDVPGTLGVSPGTLIHANGLNPPSSPINLGPDKFFETGLTGVPLIFAPAIYLGQLRGADILDDDEVTFGTSGDYKNTVFTGPIDGLTDAQAAALAIGVTQVGSKADILAVPGFRDGSLNTYQQRAAEVLYSGSLFFNNLNDSDAEILDHDILDSAFEIQALIDVLGAGSGAGQALSQFVPEPATLSLLMVFGGLALVRRRRRAI